MDSIAADTLALDSVGTKKQPLTSPVTYKAKDSIDISDNFTAQMFGESQVNYENIELTAELITMNMDSSTVYARGVMDSTGVETGTPVFKDSDTPYESKEMRYNFKSKKGFINSIVTQQGFLPGLVAVAAIVAVIVGLIGKANQGVAKSQAVSGKK